MSIVIVYLTLTIPAVILFEAFLSFLGLGIEPPKVSWGLLAVDGIAAINPLHVFWWLALFPAAAIALTLPTAQPWVTVGWHAAAPMSWPIFVAVANTAPVGTMRQCSRSGNARMTISSRLPRI